MRNGRVLVQKDFDIESQANMWGVITPHTLVQAEGAGGHTGHQYKPVALSG